jgi:hypothetical protein
MAVDRLVEEIRQLSPQERVELVRKLRRRVSANADGQPTGAASFQRIGFGMWAGRKEPHPGTVGTQLKEW